MALNSTSERSRLMSSNNDSSLLEVQLLSPTEALRFSRVAHLVYEEDKVMDPAKEKERCKKYGYPYDGRTTRRRIFWGSLLADDSWQVIHAHAAEAYGIYHTAAFVESNTTQTLTRREMRFSPGSQNLVRLTESNLFGPETKVTVDYYFDEEDPPKGLNREHLQRQSILERWQKNGMQRDDIGILSDVDEVYVRDFLRALQICDIPQFHPGQDCRAPKIASTALIFHGGPDCVVANKYWYHPDVIIGECIDLIGDEEVHKPPQRVWKGGRSFRANGHGRRGKNDYSNYFEMHANKNVVNNKTIYPLWNGADFRSLPSGIQPRGVNGTHIAFHFHNFFESIDRIRNKYLTYGHPNKHARTKPLAALAEALRFTVKCAMNLENEGKQLRLPGGFASIAGPTPLFFQDEEYRAKRHKSLRQMVADDAKIFNSSAPS